MCPRGSSSFSTYCTTMFVQDIAVLHDCWLTILSHPFYLLTTRCTFLSSVRISTFFFTVDVLCSLPEAIWYSKNQDIETVVGLTITVPTPSGKVK